MSFDYTYTTENDAGDEIEITLEVDYDTHDAEPMTLDYPGDPGGVEITSLTDTETNKPVSFDDLPKHVQEAIELAASEDALSEYEGRIEDKYEHSREDW